MQLARLFHPGTSTQIAIQSIPPHSPNTLTSTDSTTPASTHILFPPAPYTLIIYTARIYLLNISIHHVQPNLSLRSAHVLEHKDEYNHLPHMEEATTGRPPHPALCSSPRYTSNNRPRQ